MWCSWWEGGCNGCILNLKIFRGGLPKKVKKLNKGHKMVLVGGRRGCATTGGVVSPATVKVRGKIGEERPCSKSCTTKTDKASQKGDIRDGLHILDLVEVLRKWKCHRTSLGDRCKSFHLDSRCMYLHFGRERRSFGRP